MPETGGDWPGFIVGFSIFFFAILEQATEKGKVKNKFESFRVLDAAACATWFKNVKMKNKAMWHYPFLQTRKSDPTETSCLSFNLIGDSRQFRPALKLSGFCSGSTET